MNAKKLTEQELQQILSEMESINIRQQQGSISTEDALDAARNARQVLMDTFDRSLEKQTETRTQTWETVNGLINTLNDIKFQEERAQGPKFAADALLDIPARTKIQEVSRLIGKMTLNGKRKLNRDELRYSETKEEEVSEEEYVRIRTAMLNDYGKYIDSEHPELVKLRQKYMDKTLDNYEEYAKSQFRKSKRDSALAKKISDALRDGKYSNPNKAQAVINMLQPVMPDSQAQ